ncbi:MAG TPA: FecR domain-containing protein [Niabella sp.]
MADIDDIFRRFLNNSCTEEELQVLLQYFEPEQNTGQLKALIEREFLKPEQDRALPEALAQIVERNHPILIKKIQASRNKDRKVRRLLIASSIAASFLLTGSALMLYLHNKDKQQVQLATRQDIDPGTNRATLTLENGRSILLNEEKAGVIVSDKGITYTDGTNVAPANEAQYVTLSTPRKGQYQAVLPDGTRVWLNAASSLRYPTAFPGERRLVELKGEAYFEVAHNPRQPFIVATTTQQLKVLGTVFDVNAYANEAHTVTTLIEGSVELSSLANPVPQKLKPNQQAVLDEKGYKIHNVDAAQYIAWKSGEFRFRATSLPEVLRQLERWYDLEVDYSNIPDTIRIHASIRRDKKLSSVLYALEKISNVKFELNGRKLHLKE